MSLLTCRLKSLRKQNNYMPREMRDLRKLIAGIESCEEWEWNQLLEKTAKILDKWRYNYPEYYDCTVVVQKESYKFGYDVTVEDIHSRIAMLRDIPADRLGGEQIKSEAIRSLQAFPVFLNAGLHPKYFEFGYFYPETRKVEINVCAAIILSWLVRNTYKRTVVGILQHELLHAKYPEMGEMEIREEMVRLGKIDLDYWKLNFGHWFFQGATYPTNFSTNPFRRNANFS